MKISNILIYLMVLLFGLSMSSEMTVNLQYGENNVYNEIEHTHDTCPDNEETKVKIKVKVCEDLTNFNLDNDVNLNKVISKNDFFNKQIFWISNPTPPPELIG